MAPTSEMACASSLAGAMVDPNAKNAEIVEREDFGLSKSPTTVAIDFGSYLPESSSIDPKPTQQTTNTYSEGTVTVKRCARRSRIRHGSMYRPSANDSLPFDLAYRVYHPSLLDSSDAPPILILHGGPSLPSEYLHPLAEQIPNRSVIFYDQLGCGQSSRPENEKFYSIDKSIDDLNDLINTLGIKRLHLYGHSFGGVLAYEYAKRLAEQIGREEVDWESCPEILSIMLSNTSTSVQLSNEEEHRLMRSLKAVGFNNEGVGFESIFWKFHQCRTEVIPRQLSNAISNWGKIWYENSSVLNYQATPPSRWAVDLPPLFIMRGEHDFVTESCTIGWRLLFNHENVREFIMGGCAHYCHLEAPEEYGTHVRTFCLEQDP